MAVSAAGKKALPGEGVRRLPSVERLLEREELAHLADSYGRREVVEAIRACLEDLRRRLRAGEIDAPALERALARLGDDIEARLRRVTAPSLLRLVNATGIIVHTNLGRAPLSAAALAALEEVGRGYSNLEFDRQRGERGQREAHARQLLSRLFPGKTTLVVNNNAAAVLLALNTFAFGREVLISRGELVEIGGSFRIPEILEKSGAKLKEVGTTNKTRLSDYQRALGPATGLILRVHPSNFRILGFTERASTEELVALGHSRGLPVIEDFGSGNLLSLADCGLPDEPTVRTSLAAGVDLVTFSGDKLLGGPQAGVLVGAAEPIDACRRNPLARALRVDKLTYAALEATLASFVRGKAFEELPVLRMLAAPVSQIASRVDRVMASLARVPGLELKPLPGFSKVGGGAAPEAEIPTMLLAVAARGFSADGLLRKLREHAPPVIGRIAHDRVLLDLRTVAEEEERYLVAALGALG
jgi:L-seryl-tRNA(Ser) seleniumtransferase